MDWRYKVSVRVAVATRSGRERMRVIDRELEVSRCWSEVEMDFKTNFPKVDFKRNFPRGLIFCVGICLWEMEMDVWWVWFRGRLIGGGVAAAAAGGMMGFGGRRRVGVEAGLFIGNVAFELLRNFVVELNCS
ncbi:hypothetical protein Droror1_Dr00020016 [Drosera rotundifolia]